MYTTMYALSSADARSLRASFAAGVPASVLSERFGISKRTVYRYLNRIGICRCCGVSFYHFMEVLEHALEPERRDVHQLPLPAHRVPLRVHLSTELARRKIAPQTLAAWANVSAGSIQAILDGAEPQPETAKRITAVLGSAAQVAARNADRPVVYPRSIPVPTARNAP